MRCSSRFSTYHLNVRSVERSGNNLYAACAQFEGLGGKLRETELRGPNCDKDKERLRPPRDHSGTESDPEEIERLSWSPDFAPDAGAGQPPPRRRREKYYFKFLQ